MRKMLLFTFGSLLILPALGQVTGDDARALPKDPRAILAAAAPFYDFNDPSLKPWYLRVIYRLYDEGGKPAKNGAFDYWWASPKVARMAWLRAGSTYTLWHAADGTESYEQIGDALNFFESQLATALLEPLPTPQELDPSNSHLELKDQKVGQRSLPCVMVAPQMQFDGAQHTISQFELGTFPTYCFDPDKPELRIEYSFGSVMEVFNHVARVQGKYLPQEIEFYQGGREALSANVEVVSALDASDLGFKPAPDAKVFGVTGSFIVPDKIVRGYLIKKVYPLYPLDAKEAHVTGMVELKVIIGKDGAVHQIQVVKSPLPSLAAAATTAVSQWRYRPFTMNGKPVPVLATIHVIFTLGR